jgi:Trk K+ transport system NAD-binding subunit
MTHTGGLAVAALREADPEGKLIIVEPTVEKSAAAKKQFPWAEVLKKNVDEFIEYLKENAQLIDVFVACSDSDAVNYRFCKTALDMGVPMVIPVLNNPLNRELFQRSGVSIIVNPYASIKPKLLEALKAGGEIPLYESLNSQVVLQAYKPTSRVKLEVSEGEVCLLAVKADGSAVSRVKEIDRNEMLYVLGVSDAVRRCLESVRTARRKRVSG